jgi:Dullard-like phosphatase family protein
MDNNKKILIKKNQNQTQYQTVHQTQENILKQNDQNNPNLSESGATTTSSVSSNTKNNHVYGNYKTPKKKNFQIPVKKNVKTVSPDFPNKSNKIYSKGIVKRFPSKKEQNQINNVKNSNINNASNNHVINNTTINNNSKQYNRSLSQISIEQMKNNVSNNNTLKNNLNSNNNAVNSNLFNNKSQLYNMQETKKNQLSNSYNNKNILFTKKNQGSIKNFSSSINNKNYNNNIYSDEEKERIKTENKLNNLKDFNTLNKNLENNYFNHESSKNIGITNRAIVNDYDYFGSGYYSEADQKKEKSAVLNIEELLMTEEKLSAVINCMQDCKPCAEECFEWMNSYVQSELIHNIEKFFIKEQFIKIIKISVNFNIFSLILCYVISLNENIFAKLNIYLLEITGINHQILILISEYFMHKILDRNMWVEKLSQLIINYDPICKNTFQIMKEIKILCDILVNKITNILIIYSKQELISIYNELEHLSSFDLIKIYREKFHKNSNQNGSIFASSAYFRIHKYNGDVPVPFLKNKSNKPYTLVLDLDETLIHFKSNPNNESSGKIMIRPFLYDFLKNIKKDYELIIFTAATQDYADPIINAIEKDEKYFDYRLYRIHTTIIDNDFVKDLSKLGRDLNRTIIVDNMKQNYKNQPNNGITIRPFWGKDVEDTALVDLLDILKKIADKKMDVINGLKIFKEDIISKVSSNILRRSQIK